MSVMEKLTLIATSPIWHIIPFFVSLSTLNNFSSSFLLLLFSFVVFKIHSACLLILPFTRKGWGRSNMAIEVTKIDYEISALHKIEISRRISYYMKALLSYILSWGNFSCSNCVPSHLLTQIHNVVSANGTVINHNVPCPQSHSVPLERGREKKNSCDSIYTGQKSSLFFKMPCAFWNRKAGIFRKKTNLRSPE